MTTYQRAEAIAAALGAARGRWQATAGQLRQSVARDLGHPEVLDRWIDFGNGLLSRARAPRRLVHVLSGNTREAALQSLSRGLLLGCKEQFVKLPSRAEIDLDAFLKALPPELATSLTLSRELPDAVLARADAVVAFGSDESLSDISRSLRPDQLFQAHGHKLSIIILDALPDASLCRQIVQLTALDDQLGCLSPQQIFLTETVAEASAEISGALANAFASLEEESPRPPAPDAVVSQIRRLRQQAKLQAATDSRYRVHESPASTAWTVIASPSPLLQAGPGHRFLRLSPLPGDLAGLGPEQRHLSSVALHPLTEDLLERVAPLPASRFCSIAECQNPTVFWHHDGLQALASLVTWQDRPPI